MSDDLVKVTVLEGKYTFGQRKDGSCYALRYGETWREDIFDGLTLAMANRIEELEVKLAKAVEALERVMVGGNHLAIWLPDDHPTAEAEPLAALEQIGAGVSYDVWCCWRVIMLARTTLAELKGETDE